MIDNETTIESVLLVDGSFGVYVPQVFARRYSAPHWGIEESSDEWQSILAGPDNEWYWESWDTILTNARSGYGWALSQDQDGDLFAWTETEE